MQSSCIKSHSISIAGHKTSISLEDDFWNSLREIAGEHREALSDLISRIDAERNGENLSSAIRLFVICYYQDQLDQKGGMVAQLDLGPSVDRYGPITQILRMPEIPLGFSLDADDDGFILRQKDANGAVTEIKMSAADLHVSRQPSTFGRIAGCHNSR